MGVTPYSLVDMHQSFHRNLPLVSLMQISTTMNVRQQKKNTSGILSHPMLRVEECPESGSSTFLRKLATHPTTGLHMSDDVNL